MPNYVTEIGLKGALSERRRLEDTLIKEEIELKGVLSEM
jgi:hypothetical protein